MTKDRAWMCLFASKRKTNWNTQSCGSFGQKSDINSKYSGCESYLWSWHKNLNLLFSTWTQQVRWHTAQPGFEQGWAGVRALKDSLVLCHRLCLLDSQTLLMFPSLSSTLSVPPFSFCHPPPPPPPLQLIMLSQRGRSMAAVVGHRVTAAHSCSKPHQQLLHYRNSCSFVLKRDPSWHVEGDKVKSTVTLNSFKIKIKKI